MKYVLFVCTHNAGRSQIAQAFFECRVRDLIGNRLDAIRTDRSAHNRRLAQLLPSLVEEFEGRRSADEIRACGDAVLARYDEVPIRSFLITLADRAARECLRSERCYEIAV